MTLRSKLGSRERDLDVRARDLDLMMKISSHQSAAASDTDEFGLIMKTGIDRMGCALAALWVPDKNIALSLTRSGQPMSPESLQRAQHHLMAWMQLQQRTIVVNHISKIASDVAAPYKILACPVRHPSERVMGVLALFNPPSAQDFDLHQTRIAEVLAKRATSIIQAQYDSSTGLTTRQAFERQATALLGSTPANNAHIILYLDINRLHVINETFGMHVGDDVIVTVAECVAKSLPSGALSARISGDRLAALIPDSSTDAAALIAEKIRAAAAAIVPRPGQGSFEVSACLGVAPIGRAESARAQALATAEIACKAAKDRGRNRVEMFQDSDQSIIRRHTDILVIGKLRDALGNDSFRLDAQPMLPLRGNYGRPINLSGQSLQDESFLEFVTDEINSSGLAPGVLCFELTETATIGNLDADFGVDYGQGFAMGKAQPLEDLLRELAIYEATVSDWAGAPDVAPDRVALRH